MKIIHFLGMLAISALALTSAKAQSQLSGQCSCIAASPKVRQTMEERCAMYSAMGGSEYIQGETIQNGKQGETTVLPPRIEATGTEPAVASPDDYEREPVGYHATCNGITASPRVHQMLEEQRTMVAPPPVVYEPSRP
jgi:hypothetical protein